MRIQSKKGSPSVVPKWALKRKASDFAFKRSLLKNLSHDLRTSLNDIIGFSDLLYSQKVGKLNKAQKEYLGDISLSSKSLLQLINSMLDSTKVKSRKIKKK